MTDLVPSHELFAIRYARRDMPGPRGKQSRRR
jgi:hypothetical protein